MLTLACILLQVASILPLSVSITQLYYHEGEHAVIVFQYARQCDNTSVTLKIGNRDPFYHSGNILLLGLRHSQQDRFQVELEDIGNDKQGLFCYIYIIIQNVQREDIGNYICIFHNNEVEHSLFSKVSLLVIHPPGRANCEVDKPYTGSKDEWLLLRCSAQKGSQLGRFKCYQNGKLVSLWTELEQHFSSIKQTLWIHSSHPVFCCSLTYNEYKNVCACNDFKWDPVTGEVRNQTIDPCATTTASTQTDSPYNTGSNIANPHSSQEAILLENNAATDKLISLSYVVSILLFTVLVGVILLSIIRYRRRTQDKDMIPMTLSSNKDYSEIGIATYTDAGSQISDKKGTQDAFIYTKLATEENYVLRKDKKDIVIKRK